MTTPHTGEALPRRHFIKQLGLTAASAAVLSEPLAVMAQEIVTAPVEVALVGCAHIHTPSYVGILQNRKDVKVKFVWDHDQARAEKYAKQLGAQAVTDPKTIWSDAAVKAVVITSETNRHPELVLAAAAAKKHMFVEKPLGITGQDCQAMAAAIEKEKLFFTTGYFMRTQRQIMFLKEQIGQGSFGKITRIRASNFNHGALAGWFDKEYHWMVEPKVSGFGGFGDLANHSLDIMMWLMGDVESVTADIKNFTGKDGDSDETGEALLKFKSGVIGSLAAGWVDIENYAPLLISGTEGHAVIIKSDLYFKSKKVEGADGEDPWMKFPSAPPVPLEQLLNAVTGKPGMPLVTAREATARVSVMEAAYKAAHANTWVKV